MGLGSKMGCLAVLAVVVALLGGGLQMALKQPHISKAALHKVVELGGISPTIWDKIEFVDDSAWYDIITGANLGLAEAYMHGKIKMDPMEVFMTLLDGTSIGTKRKEGSDYLGVVMGILSLPTYLQGYVSNMQSREHSTRVTKQHYDVGNDLYEVMLGPTMSYTCAYWTPNAKNLEEAQTNKFDLILRKLEVKPGMKVVELGMGWATAAKYMHQTGKVNVTGVSLSEQQVKWATKNVARDGLQFRWEDYRDHCDDPNFIGYYDRLYSIGMLEHVGYKNHASFFKCIKRLLKPDGLAVVHSIGEPDFLPASDPFIDKYIFPGAVIPAMSSLTAAFENDFILEDWQNFGYDYSLTLNAWNVNADKFFLENPGAYTVEFQRMWHYYLKLCEALFDLRINQLWHFVLSPRPTNRKRISRQL